MLRAIRDPIHGNIPLSRVAAAVVDTLQFQRLRYVRQNGLLHFVFPGATHTRFAHSIGAMHVANRTWRQLSESFNPSMDREYVGHVFALAALLHDVGHCAFSHSIETVRVNDRPLLGSVQELMERWDEHNLLTAYRSAKGWPPSKKGKTAEGAVDPGLADVKHEQIGLILAKRIFLDPAVDAACKSELGIDGSVAGGDVVALMQLGMPKSEHFEEALRALSTSSAAGSKVGEPTTAVTTGLVPILAGLVSGTLDVDRMDYLLRDSFFCGVAYGRIDIDHIIAGLGLATYDGRLYLTIKEKSVLAVDDYLWSRHQMFLQVYGHKTNVALNRMLQLAIPDMILDLSEMHSPSTYAEYLEFTDDFVLSKCFALCFREKRLGTSVYARLLARREVPAHLGERRLSPAIRSVDEQEVVQEAMRIANEKGIKQEKILAGISANEIVKRGPLPGVLVRTGSPGWSLRPYERKSSLFTPGTHGQTTLPVRYVMGHFFVDRDPSTPPLHVQSESQDEAGAIRTRKANKLPPKQRAGKTKVK